jgi:DNA polymerase-3 subunit delta
VLWAICEEIRAIGKLVAGTAAGRPVSMLWREARIWAPAHQNLMQQNLGRYTLAQVSEALRHAATIDRIIKGLARGDPWDELLHLALRFARGGDAASANRGRMTAARAAEASRSQQGLF